MEVEEGELDVSGIKKFFLSSNLIHGLSCFAKTGTTTTATATATATSSRNISGNSLKRFFNVQAMIHF